MDNFKNTCQTAGRRILAINPKVLVLCEGIEIYPKDGVSWTSTDPKAYDNVWWGANLRGVRDHSVDLGADQDQLVYSPHDYGPLVFDQPWFQKPFDKASPSASASTPPAGACTATYRQTSAWSGGFQGEVTIKNTGTAAGRSWTAAWTNPAGTTVTSLWNGVLSTSGAAVTVRNADHNGALAPGASTTFGFVGAGPAPTAAITCSGA